MRKADSNDELVEAVAERAWIYLDEESRNPRVLDAMRRVDRAAFLPGCAKDSAYFDDPVPIGWGQTCSQPSMVAFMLDKLDIRPGDAILEVGAGCGYAAAIAALLCRPSGIVYAAELVPELAAAARMNCAGLAESIRIIEGDGSAGFPELCPFNKIFLSAGIKGARFNPNILIEQLGESGVLIYPETTGYLHRISKNEGKLSQKSWSGVAFVPLVGKNS